jgi:hypothetical protein
MGYQSDACAGYRWHCRMFLGQFEEAWSESDAICSRGAPDPHRLWDGTPLDGKRVIIRCLHGYGDAIQFLRYASFVRARAARVVVETHPEMVSLLSRLNEVDEVITWKNGSSKTFTDWDQQIEVMELPRVFRNTIRTIPAAVPYLAVTSEAKRRSLQLLGPHARPRVGVLWGSSGFNPARSIPFAEFSRILLVPGISFYSFQRDPGRDDLASLQEHFAIHDTAEHSPEILDTAADLSNMDLLVTVDTMAAHLAGALGIPVWTLLAWHADWRWMVDREDTPWYPTMRLFRQPREGDWKSVVDRVVRELCVTLGLPVPICAASQTPLFRLR